jgi:hypothetical protein
VANERAGPGQRPVGLELPRWMLMVATHLQIEVQADGNRPSPETSAAGPVPLGPAAPTSRSALQSLGVW